MTKVEALKALYAKLGGTPSDVAGMDEISELIGAIAEVAGDLADNVATLVEAASDGGGGEG